MKFFLAFFPLFFSCAASAQSATCPDKETLDRFVEFGDLYLGELHGTNEIPIFYRCLIKQIIDSSREPIIVSLEMAEDEVNPDSSFWGIGPYSEDGRSSKAMYRFVQYLAELESRGVIWLHFQHGIGGKPIPKNTGSVLKAFSEGNRVLALSGNIHSMKSMPEKFPVNIDTEGMYVGPNFTHISISSVQGGEIWACIGTCGTQIINTGPSANAARDALVDGSESGHDYIYYLDIERFTASELMNNNENQ